MRATQEFSTSGTKPLRTCRRQKTVDIAPLPPSEGCTSDSQTNLPCQGKKSEADAIQSCNPTNDHVSPDHKTPAPDCHEIVSDQSKASHCQPDQQEVTFSQMEPHPCKTSGLQEEAMNPSSGLDLRDKVCNNIEASETSQGISRDSGSRNKLDKMPEREVNSPSLERANLDHNSGGFHYNENLPEGSLSPNTVKSEICEENCISKGRLQEDEETDRDLIVCSRLDNSAYARSASYNVICTSEAEADLCHKRQTSSGTNQPRGRNVRMLREAGSGFHGHHQKFNQKRQTPRTHRHFQKGSGNWMAMDESYSSQQISSTSPNNQQSNQVLGQCSTVVANANLEATQNFGAHNGQQQNFASTRSPLQPVLSEAECSQNPGQGDAQLQNTQEYNQMW